MNTAKKWIAAFSAGLFALFACPLLTSVQAADTDREQVLQDTYQQWKKTYVTEDTYIFPLASHSIMFPMKKIAMLEMAFPSQSLFLKHTATAC